jgi:hypothetical protein
MIAAAGAATSSLKLSFGANAQTKSQTVVPQMLTFPTLGVPSDVTNGFADYELMPNEHVRLEAGAKTDRFTDANGEYNSATAPVAWFDPPEGDFVFGASVSVNLQSTFDAAGLMLRCGDSWWVKFVHELIPSAEPTIVSVVSNPVSDDVNGPPVDDDTIRLRAMRKGKAFALHWAYSEGPWNLARYAPLPASAVLQVGLTVQSPTGEGCEAEFSHFFLDSNVPQDIRSGE